MFETDMIFAFALFSIGLYGVSSHKDFLRIFFSLEMMINSIILMLALSAKYLHVVSSLPLAYMIIIIATLEAGVGILIFTLAYKFTHKIYPDDIVEGKV